MSRAGRSQLPRLPRRRPPWRDTVVHLASTLPVFRAGLTTLLVAALTIPTTPRGSWTPVAEAMGTFVTVITVRPATQAAVRAVGGAVRRRAQARGWGRG